MSKESESSKSQQGRSKVSEISSSIGLAPLESPAKIGNDSEKLFIGLPKERAFQERRIALTPDSVNVLVNNGHRVVVESEAGDGSHYYDIDYTEAGAEVEDDLKKVYQADIILQVTPPQPKEIKLMKPNQTLISPIHLPTLNEKNVRELMNKGVNALAFEYIKDGAGTYPIVRSMSEIAGNTAILIAGEYMSNVNEGKGNLLGGVTGVSPAKVVILGSGVVGEFATRTSLGLGAEVKIFDNSIYKLMRLQNNIGQRIFTSVINPDVLLNELRTADVAIGAIHSEEGRTPIYVTEEMVSEMQDGSIILDVSIDQGGVFETSELTSHDDPVFKKYDVTHYCVPNIPSRVARTASEAISNILTPILLDASDSGGLEKLLLLSEGLRHGVYIYKGHLTNQHLSDRFDMKFTDLNLLFAANI